MSTTPGGRLRAALVTIAAVGLAVGVASPALADSGTPLTPTDPINGNAACSTDPAAPLYWDGNASLTIAAAPGDSNQRAHGRRDLSALSSRRPEPSDDVDVRHHPGGP